MTDTRFRVRSYQPSDQTEALTLSVHSSQRPFVGQIDELIAASSASRHPFVLIADGTLVGFFHIDTAYAEEYQFALAGDYGLRAFLVDHRHQGQGFGRQAMTHLPLLMQAQYPDAKRLVLTVNCKNPTAYQLYRRYGFEDEGELYHGGAAGPQHILRQPLSTERNRDR